MSKPRDSAQRLTDRQRAALRTLAAETGPPPGHSTLAAHCVPGGKRVLWRLERAGLVEADAGWGDLYRITRAGRGALEVPE